MDEEIATEKAEEAQALKNECESDLAEALPVMEAAIGALDTLKASWSKFQHLKVLCNSLKWSGNLEQYERWHKSVSKIFWPEIFKA